MSEIAQLRREVDELRRRMDSLVRFGRVSAAGAATARVVFDDEPSDDAETVSPDLPVLQERTKGARDQRTLVPGEQVVCLFGSGGDAVQGIVLGCHYSDEEPPPLDDADARVIAGTLVLITSHTASQAFLRGDAFKALWDAHTHPTPSGPSGPPIALHRIDAPGSPGAPHLSTQIKGE